LLPEPLAHLCQVLKVDVKLPFLLLESVLHKILPVQVDLNTGHMGPIHPHDVHPLLGDGYITSVKLMSI